MINIIKENEQNDKKKITNSTIYHYAKKITKIKKY